MNYRHMSTNFIFQNLVHCYNYFFRYGLVKKGPSNYHFMVHQLKYFLQKKKISAREKWNLRNEKEEEEFELMTNFSLL